MFRSCFNRHSDLMLMVVVIRDFFPYVRYETVFSILKKI